MSSAELPHTRGRLGTWLPCAEAEVDCCWTGNLHEARDEWDYRWLEFWPNAEGTRMNLATIVQELVKLDEPQLIQLDKDISSKIWGNDGHTISYHLGVLEAGGDPVAKEICGVLADVLGAGHCAKAVADES